VPVGLGVSELAVVVQRVTGVIVGEGVGTAVGVVEPFGVGVGNANGVLVGIAVGVGGDVGDVGDGLGVI